jgi:PPOX class probable F420-dependent enzyme
MSPRPDIRLTPEEQAAFLQEARKAALATVDKDGFPHVVAMGFLARDGAIYMTSYAKAQKVLNIRRNPRVGVMIETGDRYENFRGVMIRGHCEIIEDAGQAEAVIRDSGRQRARGGVPPQGGALASAPKRVVLKVTPEKVTSWDHTKLGGRY